MIRELGNVTLSCDAAIEAYRRSTAPPCEFKVGEVIEGDDGKLWKILSIVPALRPYSKRNQDTHTIGYTFGMKEVQRDN